jgi:hypothetical protein
MRPAVGEAARTVNKCGNVPNRGERNGSRVVGDGMFRSSIEISRETSAVPQTCDAPGGGVRALVVVTTGGNQTRRERRGAGK